MIPAGCDDNVTNMVDYLNFYTCRTPDDVSRGSAFEYRYERHGRWISTDEYDPPRWERHDTLEGALTVMDDGHDREYDPSVDFN